MIINALQLFHLVLILFLNIYNWLFRWILTDFLTKREVLVINMSCGNKCTHLMPQMTFKARHSFFIFER